MSYATDALVDALERENAELREELSNAESTIDYLGKKNVDWEDKYRALAKDNAALRYVALDAYQYLYGLIYKSYTFVPERVQGIADSLRRLGVEVPDE